MRFYFSSWYFGNRENGAVDAKKALGDELELHIKHIAQNIEMDVVNIFHSEAFILRALTFELIIIENFLHALYMRPNIIMAENNISERKK